MDDLKKQDPKVENNQFRCNNCPSIFRRKDSLEAHKTLRHPDPDLQIVRDFDKNKKQKSPPETRNQTPNVQNFSKPNFGNSTISQKGVAKNQSKTNLQTKTCAKNIDFEKESDLEIVEVKDDKLKQQSKISLKGKV